MESYNNNVMYCPFFSPNIKENRERGKRKNTTKCFRFDFILSLFSVVSRKVNLRLEKKEKISQERNARKYL